MTGSADRSGGEGPVVVLAGGTGGAKLARGMLDVVGPEQLVVIANTGDDIEIYGAYVSPDADLITFWLADRIDERGWGLADDTWGVMDGMRALGTEVWFNLGDRDLAIGLERARMLSDGSRLTEAQRAIAGAMGVRAEVLPMSDRPVRTRVLADGRWWPFQEFMISGRCTQNVADVEFRGAPAAHASGEVLAALARARVIVIGPSNPLISIRPILEVPGIRRALRDSEAPVVAISPLVRGQVVKGPTEKFMRWAGQPLTTTGIAAVYSGLIDGLVADEPVNGIPFHQTDVLMSSSDERRRIASETLHFTLSLSHTG